MELKEKLFKEIDRTNKNLNLIYLYKDGQNSPWFKAYEWSAYLLEFFNNTLDKNSKLKPTRKQLKDSNSTIINVGLQFTSFEKYLPGLTPIEQTDKEVVFEVNLDMYEIEIILDNYEIILNNWKDNIEVKNNKEIKQKKSQNIYNNPVTFLSILQKICHFNNKNRTQEDLENFIDDLKTDCFDLIC